MKHAKMVLFLLFVSSIFVFGDDILFSQRNNILVSVVQHTGFFVSEDSGQTWTDRTAGLPPRLVYPGYNGKLKTLTALAVGSVSEQGAVLFVTTQDRIYRSKDSGITWERLPAGSPVKPADHFTAIAGHPDKQDTVIVGTSYSGLLETENAGGTWKRHSSNLGQLNLGAGFFEEISAVRYTPLANDRSGIVLSTGYMQKTFILDNGELKLLPDAEETVVPGSVLLLQKRYEQNNVTAVRPDRSLYAGRTGIYVHAVQAGDNRLDRHLDFLASRGMNCLVVDFKDDTGIVTYNTRNEIANKLGAVRKRLDVETLVGKVHDREMYLIARIVVFKDDVLYRQPGFPIMDKSGGPWGHRIATVKDGETVYEQREFWVDPYNPAVWDYNIALAKELEEYGVDEIQFDYIRFPSDGNLSRAVYPSSRPDMTKVEALESFLAKARENLNVPISIDVYGFNGWYRMGNWIGQNIEELSRHVDVVCPMFYPSHFPGGFLPGLAYMNRAEKIYREGSDRAAAIVKNRAVIRPYVQAFLLPSEYYMGEPEYTEYLRLQVKGTLDSRASGYLLWNNSNRYYMVTDNLAELVGQKKHPDSVPD